MASKLSGTLIERVRRPFENSQARKETAFEEKKQTLGILTRQGSPITISKRRRSESDVQLDSEELSLVRRRRLLTKLGLLKK